MQFHLVIQFQIRAKYAKQLFCREIGMYINPKKGVAIGLYEINNVVQSIGACRGLFGQISVNCHITQQNAIPGFKHFDREITLEKIIQKWSHLYFQFPHTHKNVD
jgi:hypothetical protein